MKRIFSWLLLTGLLLSPVLAQEEAAPQISDNNDPEVMAIALKIIELSSEQRKQNGLDGVFHIPYLSDAARGHSEEMMQLNYFAHDSPTVGRETPKKRLELSGGWETAMAENIYRSSGIAPEAIAERVVTAWMKSPVHRANLLNPAYNGMGVGIYKTGPKKWSITQLFAYQAIAFEEWQATPKGSGYEIEAKARIVDGPQEGVVLFGNELVKDFNGETFTLKTKTDADGMMLFAQPKQAGGYSVKIQLPVSKKVSTMPKP